MTVDEPRLNLLSRLNKNNLWNLKKKQKQKQLKTSPDITQTKLNNHFS